jgi:hypothetical protein
MRPQGIYFVRKIVNPLVKDMAYLGNILDFQGTPYIEE